MDVYTYSPEEVTFSLGDRILEDWDSISVTAMEPTFKLVKGINNKHTRVQTSGLSVEVKLAVLQTSQTNWILSEIHRIDIIDGSGRLEIFMKDLSGQSYFSSIEAFIAGQPDQLFSGNLELVEWTIVCQSIQEWSIGGNASPSESTLKQFINSVNR